MCDLQPLLQIKTRENKEVNGMLEHDAPKGGSSYNPCQHALKS